MGTPDLDIRHDLECAQHGGMIPILATMCDTGVKQFLRRGRVVQRDAEPARAGQREIQILLMKRDSEPGVERPLDQPVAVDFEDPRRGENRPSTPREP